MSRYSLSTLELMRADVSLSDVAAELGTSTTTVSRWLKGRHQAPAELWTTIAQLGGPGLAERVRDLVPPPPPPPPPAPRCGAPIFDGRATCQRPVGEGGRCWTHREAEVAR